MLSIALGEPVMRNVPVVGIGRQAHALPRAPHRVGILQAHLQGSLGPLVEPVPLAKRALLNVAIVSHASQGAAGHVASRRWPKKRAELPCCNPTSMLVGASVTVHDRLAR